MTNFNEEEIAITAALKNEIKLLSRLMAALSYDEPVQLTQTMLLMVSIRFKMINADEETACKCLRMAFKSVKLSEKNETEDHK